MYSHLVLQIRAELSHTDQMLSGEWKLDPSLMEFGPKLRHNVQVMVIGA